MPRIALLMTLSVALVAADAPPVEGADPAQRADRLFERIDTNKDGVLSPDELPERLRQSFGRLDGDGDGAISKEENRAFLAERTAGRRAGQPGAEASRRTGQVEIEPDHRDVSYGPHAHQAFDVYLAEGPGPHPVAVFIHGGGFRSGDKSRINGGILEGLRAQGITMISVNYRLSEVGPYPLQMHDGARAIQTIRAAAAQYDIDPQRLAVFGGSAGAGISQWLAMHDDLADATSDDPIARQSTKPTCAVGMAAQTSYDPRDHAQIFGIDHVDNALIPFFGMESAEDVAKEAFHPLFVDSSPINHLDADDPPVLLTYNQADSPISPDMERKLIIHHPAFGRFMMAKAEAIGADVSYLRREDLEGDVRQAQVDAVVGFIAAHLLHD